jgi:hypothetical protein
MVARLKTYLAEGAGISRELNSCTLLTKYLFIWRTYLLTHVEKNPMEKMRNFSLQLLGIFLFALIYFTKPAGKLVCKLC